MESNKRQLLNIRVMASDMYIKNVMELQHDL